jgi:hypothetical protein
MTGSPDSCNLPITSLKHSKFSMEVEVAWKGFNKSFTNTTSLISFPNLFYLTTNSVVHFELKISQGHDKYVSFC